MLHGANISNCILRYINYEIAQYANFSEIQYIIIGIKEEKKSRSVRSRDYLPFSDPRIDQ